MTVLGALAGTHEHQHERCARNGDAPSNHDATGSLRLLQVPGHWAAANGYRRLKDLPARGQHLRVVPQRTHALMQFIGSSVEDRAALTANGKCTHRWNVPLDPEVAAPQDLPILATSLRRSADCRPMP
jgi:hypothetical protein